jgi:hypothetical protein
MMATKAQKRDAGKESVPDDGLVTMERFGESMDVHPTCVDAHIKTGWKVKD